MVTESAASDQRSTPEELLRGLSADRSSGVLEIRHPHAELSRAWVREGRIYAMQVPGYRPVLGIRLLSGGLVSPEQLSAAAVELRERFPNHLIGQILVSMGFVGPEVIDTFVREQVLDQLADLLDLPIEGSTFHSGRLVQHDIIAPTDVEELLAVARERRAHRADVLASVGGPDVVPALGPPGTGTANTPLGPHEWALLCRVDGQRDITELARVCGFTVQEAAQIVVDLSLTGLLHRPVRQAEPDGHLAPVVALHPASAFLAPAPQWRFDGTDAGEPEPVGDLLAEFSAFVRDDPLAAGEVYVLDEEVEPSEQVRTFELDQDLTAQVESHEIWEPVSEAPIAELPAAGSPAAPAPEAAAPADEAPSPEPEPEPTVNEPHVDASPVITPTAAAPPAPPEAPAAAPAEAPAPAPAEASPEGDPTAGGQRSGYSDTSVFMRELSSLSGSSAQADGEEEQVVTRMVVPLTEQRKKRKFWKR